VHVHHLVVAVDDALGGSHGLVVRRNRIRPSHRVVLLDQLLGPPHERRGVLKLA
jgi:hypothetical protein